jgi:hypothetical protein
MKKKYWYCTEIRMCVLCGKEDVVKFRVYKEKDKGIHIIDVACHEHFM